MVDNFEIIKPLLEFKDENDFYFLQILQRKKDHPEGTVVGSNNSSRLIKAYNIFSVEQLDKYKKEIILMCELFEARAGINLNKRNSKVLALKIIADTARYLECNHTNALGSLWNEVCGQYQQAIDKKWIIDIDGEVKYEELFKIEELINNSQPEGKNTIMYIPSKNGLHLITQLRGQKGVVISPLIF
jgi:hypothetical protein